MVRIMAFWTDLLAARRLCLFVGRDIWRTDLAALSAWAHQYLSPAGLSSLSYGAFGLNTKACYAPRP